MVVILQKGPSSIKTYVALNPAPMPFGQSNGAAQYVLLAAGTYRATLIHWMNNGEKTPSAWNSWGGAYEQNKKGWATYFNAAQSDGSGNFNCIIPLHNPNANRRIGNTTLYKDAKTAFDNFPNNIEFVINAVSGGAFTQVIFWLDSDWRGEVGQLHFELEKIL